MIYHLVNDFNLDRRVVRTWNFRDKDYKRLLYRSVERPIVSEMLKWAIRSGTADNDLIMLTNSDSRLAADALEVVGKSGFCYSERVNMNAPAPSGPFRSDQLSRFPRFVGVDLVCFPVRWAKQLVLPKLYLGCEVWDWIMKWEILFDGGQKVGPLVWHENHGTPNWLQNRFKEPNMTNRRSAVIWAKRRGWDKVLAVWPEIVQYL